MIIIGAGMASNRILITENGTTQQTDAELPSFARNPRLVNGAFTLGRMGNGSVDGHEMKSIAVHVTQHRETDAGRYSGGWDDVADTEQTRCSTENDHTGRAGCPEP